MAYDDQTKNSHTTPAPEAKASPTLAELAAKQHATQPAPSGPESLRTDPLQAERLAATGDTGKPEAGNPVPLTADSPQVLRGRTDPQGRVKQQDAAGNVLADEKQIAADPEQLLQRQAEIRRQQDSSGPTVPNAMSGTAASTESLQHDQLVRTMRPADQGPTQAPSVIRPLGAAVETITSRRQAVEKQLRALQGQESKAAKKDVMALQAQLHELREHEAVLKNGVDVRAPRGALLAAPKAMEKNPNLHLRWVNTAVEGRADMVEAQGYHKLSEAEGGSSRGSLVLYGIDREKRADVVAMQRQQSTDALKQAQQDFMKEANTAKQALINRGVEVPPDFVTTGPATE